MRLVAAAVTRQTKTGILNDDAGICLRRVDKEI